MAKKIDWNELCCEYALGDMSVAELARRHELPYKTVYNHYVKEKWGSERAKYHALYVKKTINRKSNADARHFRSLERGADELSRKLEAIIKSNQDHIHNAGSEDEMRSEQVNVVFLEQIKTLLNEMIDVQSKLHGVLTESEWQRIELEREKIAASAASGEGSGEGAPGGTGMIVVPEVLELAPPQAKESEKTE